MTTSADTFGARLRAQRERREVSLQAIAESTKISVSLLAALERDDLSRWPKGIFRRAFLREYVNAIGLQPEPMLAEFAKLFPEDPLLEPADANEFRLMLDTPASAAALPLRARGTFALVELAGVMLFGALAAWLFGVRMMTATGVVALLYYPLARVYLVSVQRLNLLVTADVGRREWLTPFLQMRQLLGSYWRRRVVSLRRAPRDTHDETPSRASEWGTASN